MAEPIRTKAIRHVIEASECNLDAHRARHKRVGHLLRDFKLRPPSRAVPREEHGRVQPLEVSDRAVQQAGIARGEMEPADDGVERHGLVDEIQRVLGAIDHTCVAARCEHDDPFVCSRS